jgi:membrane protein implicated in regulation of membrane protease activity
MYIYSRGLSFIKGEKMSDWMFWAIAAGVVVIAELFTGTFYLLMIAIGLLVGAVAAVAGATMSVQMIVAAVVGGAASLLLRRYRPAQTASEVNRDPNVNIDVGQSLQVDAWQGGHARAMYRGAMWDVELAPGAWPAAGAYRIAEVRGSRLIVANV